MTTATIEGGRPTEVIDGWIVDAEGEVIDRVDTPDAWRADSEGAVEWALETRAGIEAELLALARQEDAIRANLARRRKALESRLRWWEMRIGPEVVAFARRSLRGRARSALFAWGRVCFRATKGSTRITDMDAAVAFADRYAPAEVKVKVERSVGVGGLDAAVAAFVAANGTEPALPFAARTGPGESVSIETGITPPPEPKQPACGPPR